MRQGIGDAFPLRGRVKILARDIHSGAVVHEEEISNLVVLTGRNLVRDLLVGDSALTLSHFAVGTGTTAAAAADTALGAEVHRDVITQVNTTDGQIEILYFLPSTQANGSSLTEAGLLTASSAGVLFSRVVHSAIAKTSSIAVTYTWQISIGAS